MCACDLVIGQQSMVGMKKKGVVQVHEVRYDKQGAFQSSAKVMDLKVMPPCELCYYTFNCCTTIYFLVIVIAVVSTITVWVGSVR